MRTYPGFLLLSGDEKTGRAILRNYIKATVGFRQLAEGTSTPADSLMRIFVPNGNPFLKNLFGYWRISRRRRALTSSFVLAGPEVRCPSLGGKAFSWRGLNSE